MNNFLNMRRIIDYGTAYFNARFGGTEITGRVLTFVPTMKSNLGTNLTLGAIFFGTSSGLSDLGNRYPSLCARQADWCKSVNKCEHSRQARSLMRIKDCSEQTSLGSIN